MSHTESSNEAVDEVELNFAQRKQEIAKVISFTGLGSFLEKYLLPETDSDLKDLRSSVKGRITTIDTVLSGVLS